MAKISVTAVSPDSPELAPLGSLPKLESPHGTRWLIARDPDFTREGPWTTTLYVFGNRVNAGILRIQFHDHGNGGVHEKWVNEKLLAADVWWGRILSTDLVLNVETGKWIYAEEADYSVTIQPCEDKRVEK